MTGHKYKEWRKECHRSSLIQTHINSLELSRLYQFKKSLNYLPTLQVKSCHMNNGSKEKLNVTIQERICTVFPFWKINSFKGMHAAPMLTTNKFWITTINVCFVIRKGAAYIMFLRWPGGLISFGHSFFSGVWLWPLCSFTFYTFFLIICLGIVLILK